ncbi:MAG: ECF transporter S component [Oscillospiraceae bacterium]
MSKIKTRTLVVIAMMTAISIVVYYLDFPIPMLLPPFIKFDFSNVISLIAGFSLGPIPGVVVCLLKNLVHLIIKGFGTTMGVGDLFDFVTSAVFTFTAAYIYKKKHSYKGAVIGLIIGIIAFTAISLPLNYFVAYPIYAKAFGGMEAIMSAYQQIMPGVKNLFGALCIFNVPFTLVKGIVCGIITMLLYKPLSPIIKGRT